MRTLRRFLALLLITFVALTAQAYGAPGDQDDDGILDNADNCPAMANPDQADRNVNGTGDACDDPDADGLSDQYELYTTYGTGPNYRYTNPDNRDTDGDSLRDGYEVNRTYAGGRKTDPTKADTDADGWHDGTEIYAGTDPTDNDTDDDGIRDSVDNCALVHNPDQKNTYGGPRGDACEPPPVDECEATEPCQLDPVAKTVTDTANAIVSQVPGADVGAAGNISKMASDGYVLSITQSANDYFTVQVLNAQTQAPVALALPDTGYYSVNGLVAVQAQNPDDTPAELSAVNVKWRYSARTKKLIVRVLPKQTGTGFLMFTVPPLGAPTANCTPTSAVVTVSCNGTASGYYNPAKAIRALDPLDAVPYPATWQK